MKKPKPFDCVQMKWDIQQKLMKEYEGMSAKEACRAQRRKIEEDPILGPYVKKLRPAVHSSKRRGAHEAIPAHTR